MRGVWCLDAPCPWGVCVHRGMRHDERILREGVGKRCDGEELGWGRGGMGKRWDGEEVGWGRGGMGKSWGGEEV